MIASARVLLALILRAALYLFMFFVIDGYAVVICGAVLPGDSLGVDHPIQAALMAAGSLPLSQVIVRAVRASISIKPRPDSVLASPEQAPQLWATVRELAERVGTSAPDEIRLVAEANASVTQNVGLLGWLPGRKCLYIGAPLLVGMPAEELRAVLCHELGHYARKHVRFGALAYRGSVRLAAAQSEIQRVKSINRLTRFCCGILYAPLSGYAKLYDRLTFAVRRRQELEADATAATITGTVVTTEALRSAHALPGAWEEFLDQYVEPTRMATGLVPNDLFRAFQAMLTDPDYYKTLVDKRLHPSERPRSPRDSHPSLAERLAQLEHDPVSTERSASAATSAATELLGAPDSLFRDLCETMPIYQKVGKSPWEEWLCRLAQCRAIPLEPLRRAMNAVHGGATPPQALTLEKVLCLLEAGESATLATVLGSSPHRSETPEETRTAPLADAVYALVGQALVDNGAARWLVNWTGPSRLDLPDTTPEEIYHWVDTAVHHPAQASRLRHRLTSLGVDLTTPVLEAKRTTEHTTDKATHKTVDKFSPIMVGIYVWINVVYLSRTWSAVDGYTSAVIGTVLIWAAGWSGGARRTTVLGRHRRQ